MDLPVPRFFNELFATAEWTPEEIENLKRAAAECPMDLTYRFSIIAQSLPGKTIVHIAQKMYELDVDGFDCHHCQSRVKHQAVAQENFHKHGNLRFCSLNCRDNYIAQQNQGSHQGAV